MIQRKRTNLNHCFISKLVAILFLLPSSSEEHEALSFGIFRKEYFMLVTMGNKTNRKTYETLTMNKRYS